MMPNFNRTLPLAVGLLILCLSACARLPTAPVGERPVVQSAPELLQQLESRAAEIRSLKAKGNVSVISPQKNYTGTAQLAVVKPSVLKVDVLNFWGQPVVAFLMNEQDMQLLIYPESKLYRGPATAENLRRFIPLPVSTQDFLAILTGRVAFELYEKPVFLKTADASRYLLELTSRQGGDRVRLTIDSQTLDILAAQWLNAQAHEVMSAEFGDMVSWGPVTGPQEIKAVSGDQASQVRIRYRDLSFNPPLTAEGLALPVSGAIRELPFP